VAYGSDYIEISTPTAFGRFAEESQAPYAKDLFCWVALRSLLEGGAQYSGFLNRFKLLLVLLI
jgi:hypothetical protein